MELENERSHNDKNCECVALTTMAERPLRKQHRSARRAKKKYQSATRKFNKAVVRSRENARLLAAIEDVFDAPACVVAITRGVALATLLHDLAFIRAVLGFRSIQECQKHLEQQVSSDLLTAWVNVAVREETLVYRSVRRLLARAK
jgi:hypothetical protein